MIKRYGTNDLAAIKEFLRPDEYEFVILTSGLLTANMLYFDIWFSSDSQGINGVVFRSYGNFYLSFNDRADLTEIASFISFMPMLDSICIKSDKLQDIAGKLSGIKGIGELKIHKLLKPDMLQEHDLFYKNTAEHSSYRDVYNLIKEHGGVRDIPAYEDYYFLRKGYDKSKTGRTYFLEAQGKVYTTASSTGEIEQLALVTDVVTDEKYGRRGLASAIVSKLAIDLVAEGKTPLVAFGNPNATNLYENLGFTKIGERSIVYFK